MSECRYHAICGLTDEAGPTGGLCILHSHQVDKDPDAFTTALRMHRQTRGDRFTHMVFPTKADFRSTTFSERADFLGATFSEQADFHGATFSKEADFRGAIFAGAAHFNTATFAGAAHFDIATFSERAHFFNATFAGALDFSGATFAGRADFGAAAFYKAATFAGAVDFSDATFAGAGNFRRATFSEQADFHGATFSKEADFRGAIFAGAAHFNTATFAGAAHFPGATFSKQAHFDIATFSEAAHFNTATFAGAAHFSGATFCGAAVFTGILFASDITFLGSHFHGRALFTPRGVGSQTPYVFSPDAAVDFRNLVLESPESVSFRRADFRTCRFLNTDLRKVELTGALWPQKGTRHVVYDEIFCYPRGKSYPWDELERLYRELKQNYDERRNYPRVGDFHYGEKEMQRRNPRTPWTLRVFLWLYRLVSGYGERFLRPLLCALVLLIGATVAYLLCGLVPKAPFLSTRPETTAFLVMPGAVSRPAPLPLTQLNAWLSALHYSFRVMTLLKPEDLEPIGFAKVVQTLQSLLGPLFLGLFALAVRQRLKH
jgi:uncharacterized protein YjbI with pentapeptide repeats